MKQHFFIIAIPALITGFILLASFGGDENSDYPSGSPAGYTGSPYDAKDCQNCHGGSTAPVSDWITSDIPSEGYTPLNSYTITVTVTGSGKKGFEVSPHDQNGTLLGTLTAGAGNKLVGGGKYVTQSSGSNSNPSVWTFSWTAPEAGTGEVTFWGAFCVGKSTTKTSSLTVQENPSMPLSASATADPEYINTGDSTHLGVLVSGGSGTYTFSWSSDPPGFTSDLADPWASPVESTIFFVEVSDSITSVTDSVEVIVYGVGEQESETHMELLLFPNPAAGFVNMKISPHADRKLTMMIQSISGEYIICRDMEVAGEIATECIDLKNLSPGLYLLVISDGEKNISRKFVKTD